MYENHTQNCLEDEFLGPHCTCMARPMENEGPKRRAEVCALADQLGLILQRRIAMGVPGMPVRPAVCTLTTALYHPIPNP